MARQRAGFSRPFRTRRNTDWGFGPDMLDQVMTSSTKILGTTSLTVSEQTTIVRIRGVLHLICETASGAGSGWLGAAGIALVNSDAFAAGVASVPGPLTDSHWDAWMWHSFFDVRAITATIGDGVNANAIQDRLIIDSKAMRKWDPAETLVLVVEGVETTSATLVMNGDSRMLLKAT